MDDFSENVFNYCIGALALCSTLASIYRYYRSILPAQRLVALNDILTEIKIIYEKADAENLFPSEAQRQHSKSRLTDLEVLTNELREKAYSSTTPFQEFLSWVRGLSETIADATCMAKKMRKNLVSLTEEERRRQLRRRSESQLTRPPSTPATVETGSTIEAPEPLRSEAIIQQASESNIPAPTVIDSPSPSRCSTLVGQSEPLEDVAGAGTQGKGIGVPGSFAQKLSRLLTGRWREWRIPTSKPLTEEPVSAYPDTIPPV
ncbi:hypothetical protein CC1G_10656 [Coprinopsis cinerea okayama7|uniref:Uncharacterized protein n=1 Tax=Coprinopsis cinerea (strain Okayama-7 / 130 / ATCC MYA-4618 / FGSC 9003) TaxID=240176 RepID=A8P662_COPC7|nr:hypothetical protein CC1G_10656 [Coprinopsis cinerea okayama7\|eukprot:XP_001839091.2 hypothetical protein CC1G_10656 [Coprinopsis cinerea okayama7\